jgi:hypothetical protein
VSRSWIAAALILLLCGCGAMPTSLLAQVPTSGPIEQGEQILGGNADQFIRVIARGPREGMSALQVVQGFLDASASFDADHAVARQYLTARADAGWDTAAGVVVYEGVGALSAVTGLDRAVEFTATIAGEISASGHYSVADYGTQASLRFGLVRQEGQWRIDRLPQGLVLSLSDVDRAFRSLAVYFFDPSFQVLVPDARMIPVIGPAQATTLVRDLVDGPSEWLQPAVRTGFPPGVELAIESVPIENGVAKVVLSANAALMGDSSRKAISEQLTWTLGQVPGVSGVEILVGALPLEVPGIGSPQPINAWPDVDPSGLLPDAAAIFERDGIVLQAGLILDRPVPGEAGTGEVQLTDLALDGSASRLAGLDSQGILWAGPMVEGAELTPVLTPELTDRRLRPPSFDRSGAIWVVDDRIGLAAVLADGRLQRIPVSGLGAEAVLVQAVPSRDGTRVALIVQDGPRRGLLLGRIVRPSVGSNAQVSEPIRVESRLTDVIDVAWSGPDTLAVIGSDGAGSPQAFEVSIARASVVAIGGPVEPSSIAAGPGLPTLVAASDGLIYARSAGVWRPQGPGRSPAYPS